MFKLKTVALIGAGSVLAACASVPPGEDAVFEVSNSCAAAAASCFDTINGALDAAAQLDEERWVTINVEAGEYYQKPTLSRGRVRLIGAGQGKTRLYYDAVASESRQYHRNNWGTPGSATLTINADEVYVSGMSVENTYDYRRNDRLPNGSDKKNGDPQGVALLVDIDADRVEMEDVALVGHQDTLFADGGRLYFHDGFIAGNVDFIFGDGMVLIQDSTIESRLRGQTFPAGEVQSFITAPSTQISQPVGIVVHRSRLTREEGLPDNSVTLGRPWHPTTTFPDGRYADPDAIGYAVYIDTWMDGHISGERWSTMNGTARDGSKTDVFRPEDSRFGEVGSSGPGARPSEIEIDWQPSLSIEEIKTILFDGWDVEAAE